MIDKEELKTGIAEAICEMIEGDKAKGFGRETLNDGYALKLDNDYADLRLVFEWEDGYGDEPRTDVIQSTKDPNYALCYKIAKRNNLKSICNDWHDLWDAITGYREVDTNYKDFLNEKVKYILKQCEKIKEIEKENYFKETLGEQYEEIE